MDMIVYLLYFLASFYQWVLLPVFCYYGLRSLILIAKK